MQSPFLISQGTIGGALALLDGDFRFLPHPRTGRPGLIATIRRSNSFYDSRVVCGGWSCYDLTNHTYCHIILLDT
jgi:hypothetical protein